MVMATQEQEEPAVRVDQDGKYPTSAEGPDRSNGHLLVSNREMILDQNSMGIIIRFRSVDTNSFIFDV